MNFCLIFFRIATHRAISLRSSLPLRRCAVHLKQPNSPFKSHILAKQMIFCYFSLMKELVLQIKMERSKFRILTLIADIVILTIAFLAMVWIKPASLRSYLPSHAPFFGILALIWIMVSLLNGKLHRGKVVNYTTLFNLYELFYCTLRDFNQETAQKVFYQFVV